MLKALSAAGHFPRKESQMYSDWVQNFGAFKALPSWAPTSQVGQCSGDLVRLQTKAPKG